jgi:SpoIID/LytB domain protein
LVVRLVSPSAVQVVVTGLDMERYLYGLAEVPSTWPATALQAQALAGRSYAKFSIDSRRNADPNRTYDLDAGTIDQVYAGDDKAAGPSGAQWVAAVDATASQVITYGGSTVQAFYSSSTGGYTENSEYVFVATVPYLRAVPDPGDATASNPNHRWTRTFTGSELQSWTQAKFGVNVGPVTAMDFTGPFGASGRIDRAFVRLTGPNASKTMTAKEFMAMIQTFAPSRALLSTLLFLNPFGQFDGLVIDPGGARFFGWAIDPKTSAPINVQAQIDGGPAVTVLANTTRSDVGAAYPSAGPNHGFDAHLDLSPGAHTVCVTALGIGSNTGLGCRSITRSGRPIGQLDGFQRMPNGVHVQGWALDPDTVNPIDVHVYVDGAFAGAASASGNRPDVASLYPAWGPNHGYDITIPASPGRHTVCTYAINVGVPDANPSLGCRTVDVSGDPFGILDATTRTPNKARVQGWVLDPDTSASIDVHVYVDGQFAGAFHATGSRPDVAAAYPGYGAAHGFDATVASPAGHHQVCVYGINNTLGNNPLLSCTTPNGSPVGNADAVESPPGGGLTVNGWALDPDNTAPITVHTYIDGQFNSIATANQSRPDVGNAYPSYGSNHGYSIPVPAGHHTVCVFAIDPDGGLNPGVGCLSY